MRWNSLHFEWAECIFLSVVFMRMRRRFNSDCMNLDAGECNVRCGAHGNGLFQRFSLSLFASLTSPPLLFPLYLSTLSRQNSSSKNTFMNISCIVRSLLTRKRQLQWHPTCSKFSAFEIEWNRNYLILAISYDFIRDLWIAWMCTTLFPWLFYSLAVNRIGMCCFVVWFQLKIDPQHFRKLVRSLKFHLATRKAITCNGFHFRGKSY